MNSKSNKNLSVKKCLKEYISNKFNLIFLGSLILFILIHLPVITRPPLDEHSWRQTDTAAVIRNFQEESPNIFQPRIDMRQNYTGITGMEFPAYNYLVYLTNKLFGFQHWMGRVVTLLFSLAGLSFFFEFVKLRFNQREALMSSVILMLFPIYIIFSKNIQPDIMMLSMFIASLYFAQKYKFTKSVLFLLISSLLFMLACLVKIPAVMLIPVFALVVPIEKKNKALIILLLLIFVSIITGWYFYSNYLSHNFGLGEYFYGDYSLATTLALLPKYSFWFTISRYIFIKEFIFGLALPFIFFGVWSFFNKKDYLPLLWFVCSGAFLVVFASKSFYHNYYSLILLPPLALLMAQGILWVSDHMKKTNLKAWKALCIVLFALVLVIIPAMIFKRYVNVKLKNYQLNLLLEEKLVENKVPKNSLIATNGNGSPAMLYFSHRKGWSLSNSNFLASPGPILIDQRVNYILLYNPPLELIDKLADEGYILLDKADQTYLFRLGQQ